MILDNGIGELSKFSRPPAPRRFELRMRRSVMDDEEYELYKRYQMTVHNDEEWECSPHQYRRFLVSSPLTYVSREDDANAPECGYGAFHMQYRVDGRLVAVGVVDILPRCLSSKYLFWDPDLAALSLGKISALKEIDWVQRATAESTTLKYYYMGYYIHSCQKMRYKGEYRPSELLCPRRLSWVVMSPEVLEALDEKPFVVLSEVPGAQCSPNAVAGLGERGREGEEEEYDVEVQRVAVSGKAMLLRDLLLLKAAQPRVMARVTDTIKKWGRAAGPTGTGMVYTL